MPGRLFLKVYLTILGAIVILALAGATAVMLLGGAREERGWLDQRAALLAAALPETDDPGEMQAALDRIGPASRAGLTVRGPDGATLATHAPDAEARPGRFDPVTVPMPGGGTLTARFEPPFDRGRGHPLILLAVVAGLTALVAWPVVRHLTGRLERLRHGVETWGEGDLSLRVPVEGGDEIAAVATSFNRAAAQVEGLVASNRALLANASHELRSPLSRLRMAVGLYEPDPGPARRAEIERNLAELDDLVGEILLSSRLTHDGPAEPFQPVDLLALAAEEAARAGLEVSGRSVEVTGDARLLSRLLGNLIQNAKRHGRPPVEIAVGRAVDHAVLTVRDHGLGIPGDDADRVFEPFYRPAGHGEDTGGWGLGLALVRQIAERHRGTVDVAAPPGGGTEFVDMLPLAAAGGDGKAS
jgi:signal transduction histidine kinase